MWPKSDGAGIPSYRQLWLCGGNAWSERILTSLGIPMSEPGNQTGNNSSDRAQDGTKCWYCTQVQEA